MISASDVVRKGGPEGLPKVFQLLECVGPLLSAPRPQACLKPEANMKNPSNHGSGSSLPCLTHPWLRPNHCPPLDRSPAGQKRTLWTAAVHPQGPAKCPSGQVSPVLGPPWTPLALTRVPPQIPHLAAPTQSTCLARRVRLGGRACLGNSNSGRQVHAHPLWHGGGARLLF